MPCFSTLLGIHRLKCHKSRISERVNMFFSTKSKTDFVQTAKQCIALLWLFTTTDSLCCTVQKSYVTVKSTWQKRVYFPSKQRWLRHQGQPLPAFTSPVCVYTHCVCYHRNSPLDYRDQTKNVKSNLLIWPNHLGSSLLFCPVGLNRTVTWITSRIKTVFLNSAQFLCSVVHTCFNWQRSGVSVR